jgi:hypothetical protein
MLGEGRHFGEYYGKSIQRGYGLDHKRFALFNVSKWAKKTPDCIPPLALGQSYCPDCCEVVPTLYDGDFDTNKINEILEDLKINGSRAVPGYFDAEGVVIYHCAAGQYFKKTITNDSGKHEQT